MKLKKDTQQIKEINSIKGSLKKYEFWLGVSTVVIVLGIFAYSTKPLVIRTLSNASKKASIKQITPFPSITPTQSPLIKIKKIADTGVVAYTAVKGDTFWSISQKVCKTGVFFQQIKQANGYGYNKLQPGDVIQVTCE